MIGEAAYQGAILTATVASSESAKDPDEKLKDSVEAFNAAFRCEDYAQAFVFVSPEKKENFWSEADRFRGKIRMTEYELRDLQLDEKRSHATVILHLEYWRMESPILEPISFTQKWQYSEKHKTWRVSDSGFEAIPSNSY